MCYRQCLSKWAEALQASRGMRRSLLAMAAGALATLALPPVYLLPFVFPSFTALLLLLHSAPNYKRAFADGWWFGVGFFTTNLYWITISLFVDIGQFWWLVPFALFGLPVCIALFIGLMGVAYTWLRPKGVASLIAISTLWTLAEFARGHMFTGFPWNLIGYVWMFSTPSIQIGSVIGIYGMSYITILLAAAPGLLLLYPEKRRDYLRLLLGIVALWLVITFWGVVRLDNNPTQYTDTTVRLVQGNIEQTLKWDMGAREKNLQTHIDLSRFRTEPADIVIWPETAFPFYMNPKDEDAPFWRKNIPPGTVLLTGAVRVEGDEKDFRIFNSLVAIDHEGNKPAIYDKNHLVPFGEYVPFSKYLPLEKITHGRVDFSTGDGSNILMFGKVPPFAVLICYEAIFPEKAVMPSSGLKEDYIRPEWLVNITNDAWFGVSSGPYQHLEMARMRAVEQGLPLVRAANTGISAMFDGYGRIILKLELNQSGSVHHKLPRAVSSSTSFGYYFNGLIYIVFLFSALYLVIRRKNPG